METRFFNRAGKSITGETVGDLLLVVPAAEINANVVLDASSLLKDLFTVREWPAQIEEYVGYSFLT